MDSKLPHDMTLEILSRTSLKTFNTIVSTNKEFNKLTYNPCFLHLYKQRNSIVSGFLVQHCDRGLSYSHEFAPSQQSTDLDLGFLPRDARILATSEQGIMVFESPHLVVEDVSLASDGEYRSFDDMKMVKYEGKLALGCKARNGGWEIWVIIDRMNEEEWWEKKYVFEEKEDDMSLIRLNSFYDSGTSVVVDYDTLIHGFDHGFQSLKVFQNGNNASDLPNDAQVIVAIIIDTCSQDKVAMASCLLFATYWDFMNNIMESSLQSSEQVGATNIDLEKESSTNFFVKSINNGQGFPDCVDGRATDQNLDFSSNITPDPPHENVSEGHEPGSELVPVTYCGFPRSAQAFVEAIRNLYMPPQQISILIHDNNKAAKTHVQRVHGF
ncbi:hypothetical protein L6452_08538 [Arctium lappa]|uniref:Uncharacterized protein n=1 Tax=Arctium lappa TaxID=4217 RepID=A0ACB9DI10_ARCLA|nr:hypothetical protein L6452_08538 [Arctium lappa]